MRSRGASGRLGVCLRATIVAALALGAVASPVAAAEDDPLLPVRDEIERLRRDMELAFLDVQRDHERVRAADWARGPFGDDFSSVVTDLVRDARARAEPRTPAQDMADASGALQLLAERRVDPPLTRTSMPVVLAEAVRAARADRTAVPRELFATAARTIFAAAKAEDAWDACFLSLPAVTAFRAAQARLAAAQEKAAGPRAPEPPPEKLPEKPPDKAGKPLDDLVQCDRARPWIGPWTGWTTDVSEKQNKRAQRPVKAVWIDRYEVTCAQYRAYLESLGPVTRRAMLPRGWTIDDAEVLQLPPGKDRHPVTGVTWRQAQSYAESQGKRLATSDEWERAAGGGEKEPRAFPWGPSEEGKRFSHIGVEPKGTVAVDAFTDDATPDGVIGMAGNAAELVATYPDHTDIPKSGPEKGKQVLVCGGSFNSRASECGTSWRWVIDAEGASAASPSVGFRCVMDDAEYRKRHK